MATKFDTVYYWVGGTLAGEWRETLSSSDEERREQVASIRKGGRVAHLGYKNIGPPEGPPSGEEMRAVWGDSTADIFS